MASRGIGRGGPARLRGQRSTSRRCCPWNFKALANIGAMTTVTEVEKYRIDENCKPCSIYKTENRTKSSDEFFKFVSRL